MLRRQSGASIFLLPVLSALTVDSAASVALETLSAAVKESLPGSLRFLAFGTLIGLLLSLGPSRAACWGRRWLAALLFLYGVLSLQGTSDLLLFGLSRDRSLSQIEQAHGAQTIVVLSNGVRGGRSEGQELFVVNEQSAYNALEAARVYRLLGNPAVLASGGVTEPDSHTPESQALAVSLESLGIPHERIALEIKSRTTFEQAVNVAAWLKQRGQTRFVLVTTPEHMRRATGVFNRLGADPIPSPSQLRYGGSPWWQPTRYALIGSENAIYEYLAWCLYRARGWL